MEDIRVILPPEIYVLRDGGGSVVQYSIYYKNLFYPYRECWDIQVRCPFGKNLGNMWRIESCPEDVSEFPLTFAVYGDFGEKLCERTCKVVLTDASAVNECKLMCIGDSMTHQELYIEQAVKRAGRVRTLGNRSIGGGVCHEGRPGWMISHYFTEEYSKSRGTSLFLFPVGIDAKDYYGDEIFWDMVRRCPVDECTFGGFTYEAPDGYTYSNRDGRLVECKSGKVLDSEYEFSFSKYLQRYSIDTPDVVSLLFGANDFQYCSYEEFGAMLDEYVEYMDQMVRSIKLADQNIGVIINLPVCGADQYSWGSQLRCTSSCKQYDHHIKMAGEALIQRFGGREGEGIRICPMLLTCCPETGFDKAMFAANAYTDKTEEHHNNWVHPGTVGYMQMGDALAATIAAIKLG